MRIGFDVNPLVTGHRFRGIGVYVKNLLHAFPGLSANHSFYLYSNTGSLTFSQQKNTVLRKIGEEGLLRLIAMDGIEVLHITDFYHPIYTLLELEKIKKHGVKVVVTIADAIPLRFPDKYPAEKRFMEINLNPLLPLADRVIAISQTTSEDLIHFFSLPPAAVSVTHLGVDLAFFSPLGKDSDKLVLQKYRLKNPYFLYVGGFDWRKNCETILQAFSVFQKKVPSRYQLVFVGNDPLPPAMYKIFADWPEKPIATGFVPADELPPLYRQATALLFPSRFEGFGLPVLEAMACGTPVICSDKASLPEIVNDGGILIDPDCLDGWAEAMVLLSSDKALAETVRAKGMKRVLCFSWEECARNTLQAYSSF